MDNQAERLLRFPYEGVQRSGGIAELETDGVGELSRQQSMRSRSSAWEAEAGLQWGWCRSGLYSLVSGLGPACSLAF